MTVSSTQIRVSYVGDGISTVFTIPYLFYATTDLLVLLGGTPQSSGFSVSGAGTGSGVVTFTAAPAASVVVQIILNVPLLQQANFVDGTAFPSATVDQVNDRAIQASLRLNDLIQRSIRAPDGPDTVPNMLLPAAATRANQALMFDVNGDITVGTPVTQTVTQSLIGQTLYPRTAAEIAAGVTPTNYAYAPGDVRRYGITGSGDETTKLQTALNVQQDVFIPSGMTVNTTSAVTLLAGQTLYGAGWDSQILCTGSAVNAVTLSATRSIVRDVFIKHNGTSTTGLNGAAVFLNSTANFCSVKNCRLEGIRAGVIINLAQNSAITDNLISSINPPDVGWDIAVYLGGSHNLISRNKCFGGLGAGGSGIGTTGINILSDTTTSCDWNIIAENEVGTHSQYGIVLYSNAPSGSAQHNTVTANIVHDITGSYNSGGGLVFGTGIYVQAAEWTTVVGNFIYNTNVNTTTQSLAPGAIGVNGTSCFTIVGNVIRFPSWYGIYVVANGNLAGSGLIEGNVITSPAHKDGIALAAIDNVTVMGNAVTGATQFGISYTNSIQGNAIAIIGNKVKGCATALNLTQLSGADISHNQISSCTNGLNLTNATDGLIIANYFTGTASNDVFLDNTNNGYIHFDRNIVRSNSTNGVNDSAGMVYGDNVVLGPTNPYAGSVGYERVLATAANPSVLGSASASYGGGTAITDLTGGYTGQRLVIRATGAITLNHNAGAATTKLIMRAGANLSLSSGQTATFELVPGGPWYQVN